MGVDSCLCILIFVTVFIHAGYLSLFLSCRILGENDQDKQLFISVWTRNAASRYVLPITVRLDR